MDSLLPNLMERFGTNIACACLCLGLALATGGGIIGMAEVARSPADGQTLLYYNDAVALIPFVFKNPGFDTLKDFSPITQTLSAAFGLFAHPSVPANTLRELVAYSRANPGKLNGSSGGAGTASHLFFEAFKQASGADMQHIQAGDPARSTVAS